MNKHDSLGVFFLIALFAFNSLTSCRYNDNSSLNYALEKAGENRTEIEHVLAYFKTKGKMPYKAACFIVENMPYHKSRYQLLIDPSYDLFFRKTDSIYTELFGSMQPPEALSTNPKNYDSVRIELAKMFAQLPPPEIIYVDEYDIATVSSVFLINNINDALEEWKRSPFLRNMPFDEFKEFILPYRTTNENLMFDKTTMKQLYENVICRAESAPIRESLENFKVYVDRCRWINENIRPKEHSGIYDLFIPKFNLDCHNMTNWSCNILRSCGIPVVYEFTPQWRERGQRHFWCVSPDSSGIWKPYTAPDNNLMEDWESKIKYASKVYRKTFEAQRNTPYFRANADENIPEYFNTPLLKDQTWRYQQTVTLSIPLSEDVASRVAYLCMDNQGELNPVGWGIINKEKRCIVYEQVPLNILFFPTHYDEGNFVGIGEPFMLQADTLINNIPFPLSSNVPPAKPLEITVKDGQAYLAGHSDKPCKGIFYLSVKADTSQMISMTLLRKYPEKLKLKKLRSNLKGALLLGSSEEEGNYDTLHIIDYIPHPYLQEIAIKEPKEHRYYRFQTHTGKQITISHLEFLGPKSSAHRCAAPTPLPIFSREQQTEKANNNLCRIVGKPLKTGRDSDAPFDGDCLTFARSSSVGMDFGTPVKITHIRFIPRTANNGIVPQNNYSLMYYDDGWKHFSTQLADNHFLAFDNVPKAKLFWLQNLTEGKEEQPFFYINGKQLFLHIDTIKSNLFIREK